jgi:glycosyltransferase involved in cell wall biosynthesis
MVHVGSDSLTVLTHKCPIFRFDHYDMKILYVSYDYRPGGISEGYTSFEIIREMLARGYEASVLTRDRVSKPEVIHVPIHRWPKLLVPLKLGYYEFIYKALRSVRGSEREYALIHHLSPISLRYPNPLCNLDAPFIWGPVGGSIPYPPGFSSIAKNERFIHRLRAIDGLRLNWDPGLVNVLRKSRRIVLTTSASRAMIPAQYQEKCVIIPEGFGAQAHSFDATGDQGDYIFSSGRLVAYKAINILLDAFALCSDRVPRLVITGDGPERQQLEERASRLNIGSKVTFMGRVSKPENISLMANSLFCVFPALNEAFGHVYLESMSCGKAVIATNWGGPADIVVNDETGFCVLGNNPKHHAELIAEKMVALASDSAKTRSMGKLGKSRVENVYSWKKIGESHARLYRDLLDEGKPRV